MTPASLLDHILRSAGEPAANDRVELVGADPIFPTPLRIGEVGAAAIAACGLGAARLFETRTSMRQLVRVEVDAAAAAMRSSRYLRVETEAPRRNDGEFRPRGASSGLGVYRTRDDRWMYLHRLFPHHRQRTCAVLECADEEASIADAVRSWDGQALEEAVFSAGSCCGLVRAASEWQHHEQARALARLPLWEILRIGDGPVTPLPAGERPLSGVRMLDLTRVLAGPTCGRTLAEYGADVLRVGSPRVPDNEAMMRDTGHGKRSTALELTARDDADALLRLVEAADVFAQGYRPGAIAALGFSPEAVAARRPGIIYVSLSAFGHEGPWSDRRGFDSIVQAVSGIADEHAVEGRPRFTPANPLDYITGYLAAFGVMVALGRRAREGGSYLVRLSLAQTGRWLASLPRVDPDRLAAALPELPAERLEALMVSSDTPFGRLRHLAPAAWLSATPPRWDRPSVPLDHDPPAWL